MIWTIRLLDVRRNVPATGARGPGNSWVSYLVISILSWASMAPLTASQAAELRDYSVQELLRTCEEGDNDARWGAGKEAECEQFINGFTGAYIMFADGGKDHNVCLPAPGNRPDEIRWAFMKWAYKNFDKKNIPAAQGLMEVVRSKFPCS